MHKAMKALTLALVAAAAGRAQADLVVSALFGTEPPPYVHAAVANVLRHNRDGLGAPTPGDAVDGVVVAASAPHERIERTGISSGLEALAALHRKGALTDSEFAAAKAKLLG